MLQHFHHVMLDNAHIRQPELFELLEKTSHARGVNFNGDIVMPWMCLGDSGGCFAHPETDLQKSGRTSAKDTLQIKQFFFEGNAIFRHQRLMGAVLGIGNTALAKDKAADGTVLCHVRHPEKPQL